MDKSYLDECFVYSADTGLLVWRDRPAKHFKSLLSMNSFNSYFSGKPAGGLKSDKRNTYLRVCISGKKYYAHQLIWIMQTGNKPEQIDHIDGNGLNNRFSNLRSVKNSINSKNRRLNSNNKSGLSGVRWNDQCGKWHSRIRVDFDYKHLGLFSDFFEACCARKSAERKYGFTERHGKL